MSPLHPPAQPDVGLDRAAHWAMLRRGGRWDLVVIGGGATGLGVALDAAARGWRVALFEAHDLAEGTSSRSTKLLHGGVRYLAQGHWPLVREALHERAAVLAHAPHLAQPLPFVVPAYGWGRQALHAVGLSVYGWLAGRRGLGATEILSARQTRACLPTVQAHRLRGSVKYWDGQFDDARLALALARTAAAHGALVLNHCPVVAFTRVAGRLRGVEVQDRDTGERLSVSAACVVNATGVWVDAVQRLGGAAPEVAKVTPSQGVHLVVDRAFLPGGHALLVPKTSDGRVLFAIPWLGKTLLGTTDTARNDVLYEPEPTEAEVNFILQEAGRVLHKAPTPADVRSVWVGLRPLVRAPYASDATASLSREHSVWTNPDGLVSVTGGKWTTYRAMAEDVLAHCQRNGSLPAAPAVTERLALWGRPSAPAALPVPLSEWPGLHSYGSDAARVLALPGADRPLWTESGHVCLTEAMVRHAVRNEMARTVTDVLARRCRLLFLDAQRAYDLAPRVGELLAEERGPDFDASASVQACRALAQRYLALP